MPRRAHPAGPAAAFDRAGARRDLLHPMAGLKSAMERASVMPILPGKHALQLPEQAKQFFGAVWYDELECASLPQGSGDSPEPP